MLNVDFLNIDNAKLIGRLLPFWARGRKISLLLAALLSPLVSIHNNFKAWALEKYIFYHITAQTLSLQWYLRYKLKHRFANFDDNFTIVSGLQENISCFSAGVWRGNLYWHSDQKWGVNLASAYNDQAIENADKITVFAPAITTNINYSQDDYKRDIMIILSQFMINTKSIVIFIN